MASMRFMYSLQKKYLGIVRLYFVLVMFIYVFWNVIFSVALMR